MRKISLIVVLSLGLLSLYLFKSTNTLPEYEHWFQMTWKEQDVGYMQRQASRHDEYYEIRLITRVKTTNQGVDFSFNEQHVLRFSLKAEQPLLSSYYRLDSPHNFTETRLSKIATGYRLWSQVNNKITETTITDTYTVSDYQKLQEWLKSGPEKGDVLMTKTLNPSQLELSTTEYRLDDIANNLLTVSYQSADSADIKTLSADEDGFIHAYVYNDIIRLSRVATEAELTVSSSEDYYATQMIPLDKPLGNPMQWQQLQLQVSHTELLEQLSTSQRQQAQDDRLLLNADISIRAHLNEAERYSQLPDDESLQERLETMAVAVTSNYNEPIDKLTALREYVATYINDVPRIQSANLSELLDNPEGDCTEHANLFNALASSLGFKARTVNGLVYLGDNFQGFGGHQWSEVLINGYWVGFDPTWNINALSATHIRFNEAAGEQYFNRSARDKGYKFTLLTRE